MTRLDVCQIRTLDRAFHHHLARTGGDGGGEQLLPLAILARPLQAVEQLELLLHRRALSALGEHRVQIDDVGRRGEGAQGLDAIARAHVHTGGDIGEVRIIERAGERVFQQSGDHRVALAQRHLKAGCGEQK